jgi:regulation of enolase protein 1 (concanavalin A-like superfamily)
MKNFYLKENFGSSRLDDRLSWHNRPKNIEFGKAGNGFTVAPEPETDFWQRTLYGFKRDNGHFLYCELGDNFILETSVSYAFKHQYDQAGLMVRMSPECWIKTSVEYEQEGENKLGAVVTNNGFSDWSTQDCSKKIKSISFRILRKGSDYTVQYRHNQDSDWIQIRVTHLQGRGTVKCGIYACSPEKSGFMANFHYLTIETESGQD